MDEFEEGVDNEVISLDYINPSTPTFGQMERSKQEYRHNHLTQRSSTTTYVV